MFYLLQSSWLRLKPFVLSQKWVENKNNNNDIAEEGKEASERPKEHSSGSTRAGQADRKRLRRSQPHSTNSCAVPSRGAWGSSGGTFQEELWHTWEQVCPPPPRRRHFCRCASEFQHICRNHMHTQAISRWKEGSSAPPLLILFAPHN